MIAYSYSFLDHYMMADEEDSTSRKLPSDPYGDERPVKKARYLWQIKGKYRLKQPRG